MRIIYITAKDSAEAKKISSHLIKKNLAACTNIFPIQSMYMWKGKMQEDIEFVILAKTDDDMFEDVEKEVLKVHGYDTPAIYSWKADKVNKKYDEWLKKNLKK